MCRSNEDVHKWVLLGTASFSTKSCAIGYPDVFTRVTSFGEWIMDQVEANGGPGVPSGN